MVAVATQPLPQTTQYTPKASTPIWLSIYSVFLSSTEAGTWSALEQGTGQPNARRSVWGNEDLLDQSHPIFRRVLETLYNDENVLGPFPMPGNLRHSEVQDIWANTSREVWYGETPFDEGMQNVQDSMQEILDLPRA